MTDLLHRELSGTIIGVYYDVFNNTSRTYPEFIYERAMQSDLNRECVACQSQTEYEIVYKDKRIGIHYLDLFVEGKIIVEIKVVPELTNLHKAQTFSYLKVTGRQVGLLCNFGGPKPEFERLYFDRHDMPHNERSTTPVTTGWAEGLVRPQLTGEVIAGLYEVHSRMGPGFVHRVYANAVYQELSLRGLEVLPRREYEVIYRGRPIGRIKFGHLQVEDSLMVFPVAVSDINEISINNLKAWMETQKIPLGILANFHQEKLHFLVLRA
jgi:GxxExxY protein